MHPHIISNNGHDLVTCKNGKPAGSTSRCQSTLFASKCDCLDRAMLLLAFLNSPSVFFVLATIGIVDYTFLSLPVASLCPVPFPFFVHETAILLPSGRDGMERIRHRFFGGYCSLTLFFVHEFLKFCAIKCFHHSAHACIFRTWIVYMYSFSIL